MFFQSRCPHHLLIFVLFLRTNHFSIPTTTMIKEAAATMRSQASRPMGLLCKAVFMTGT